MARFGLSQVMERVVHARDPVPVEIREVLSEETFRRMIAVERKRTERSNEPFLLMLLEGSCLESSGGTECALRRIVSALLSTTRDTDLIGWYDKGPTVGVLYTGLSVDKKSIVLSTILNKVSAALGAQLSSTELSQVSISFHFFPDEWHQENSGHPNNPVLYPDLLIKVRRKRVALAVKRTLDTVGSALLLLLSAPLMLLIAIAVKLSSAGPVLFKQQRVGRNGKVFTFLKFRSMFVNNDEAVHKDFVSRLIANNALPEEPPGRREAIYKLRGDKRVTRVGRLLRRTSLDELPQLFNVLKGDMSLVGPRPAIPYEVESYKTWHRGRVLEVKPGITGLWQVNGRSRVKFDDMVRLDLRYAVSWSAWGDFKILVRTPLAVIKGTGAC